jgi:hypothetical protein
MYKRMTLGAMVVLGAVLFACGDDSGNGNGGDAGTDTNTDFFVEGCDKLEDYCLDRIFWLSYGITSSEVCQETFGCVNDFYEGDQACQDRVAATLECGADLVDESGCRECEDLAGEIQANCDYPEDCM